MTCESQLVRIVGYHQSIVRNDYSDDTDLYSIQFSSIDQFIGSETDRTLPKVKRVGVMAFELFVTFPQDFL